MTVSIALWLLACTADDSPSVSDDGDGGATDDGGDAGGDGTGDDATGGGDDGTGEGDDGTTGDALASNVEAVAATGDPGAYTFAATLRSPDVDCDQYSDWWEVLTPEGVLVYRRILDHSHAHEQPFTRDGGPVKVGASDPLIVRGHFHPTGYGGAAMSGSVAKGFVKAPEIGKDFAPGVESKDPQPEKCLF
jgi:hypothetical protein